MFLWVENRSELALVGALTHTQHHPSQQQSKTHSTYRAFVPTLLLILCTFPLNPTRFPAKSFQYITKPSLSFSLHILPPTYYLNVARSPTFPTLSLFSRTADHAGFLDLLCPLTRLPFHSLRPTLIQSFPHSPTSSLSSPNPLSPNFSLSH